MMENTPGRRPDILDVNLDRYDEDQLYMIAKRLEALVPEAGAGRYELANDEVLRIESFESEGGGMQVTVLSHLHNRDRFSKPAEQRDILTEKCYLVASYPGYKHLDCTAWDYAKELQVHDTFSACFEEAELFGYDKQQAIDMIQGRLDDYRRYKHDRLQTMIGKSPATESEASLLSQLLAEAAAKS